jgi:murein DD-endopeptidase / murein LD-carboxypeptidase
MTCSHAIPVLDDVGARISARAASHIGAPFRLHGRSAIGGFDCVGLATDALRHVGLPCAAPGDYSLRGQYEADAFTFFESHFFARLTRHETPRPGDFALVRPAPRQLHVMICAAGGFVHAHAGLRRVVLTPAPTQWPVIGQWRLIWQP